MKILRKRKLQTFMMFMIILLCSMLLTGSVGILTSLEKPFKDFAKECKSPAGKVYSYDQSDKAVLAMGKQFSKLDLVKKVIYTRRHNISEEITFKGKKIDSFSNLTEYNEKVYGKVRYIKGSNKIAKALKANECILPACVANKYKIHIGNKIKIKFAKKTIEYTIKGIFADPYNTSTAFNGDILVKQIPSFASNYLMINLYGKNGVSGERIQEVYREKHNGLMNAFMLTEKYMLDNSIITGKILGGILLGIGFIMLLVSGLIIHFMIKNAMIADAKAIAVYKTIGYTSGDILKMFMKVYFIVVTIACVIGIGSSVLLSNTFLTSIFENIGQVTGNNVLIPGSICYVVTVGFVLLIIYFIVNKARKVRPVVTLTGVEYGVTKKKNYKGNSKLQFSALGIALRTLLRDKKGAVSIIITCIITIFSINFAIISLDVASTMKQNNDYWFGIDKCDVMVSVSDSKQYETVRKVIEKDNRVKRYLKNSLSNEVTMKWKKGMDSTQMDVFAYDDFKKAKVPVVKGRNPSAGNEIAISTKMTDVLNKDVGDYLEVYLDKDKKVNMLITGVFQTYYELGDVCRVNTKAYKDNQCKVSYDNFSVYLKNPKDISKFTRDIKRKIGNNGEVIKRTEKFRNIMEMIVAPQQKAIPPVVVLVLLVAGINIFSIILLKNMNAQRTNGIYKCIGYTTWHLIGSNLWYVGIIAVVSVLAAIPLTISTYPYIMKISLSMFGFIKYPVQYNIAHITLANIVTIIIFIASTLVSSQPLFKVSARELVQE